MNLCTTKNPLTPKSVLDLVLDLDSKAPSVEPDFQRLDDK